MRVNTLDSLRTGSAIAASEPYMRQECLQLHGLIAHADAEKMRFMGDHEVGPGQERHADAKHAKHFDDRTGKGVQIIRPNSPCGNTPWWPLQNGCRSVASRVNALTMRIFRNVSCKIL